MGTKLYVTRKRVRNGITYHGLNTRKIGIRELTAKRYRANKMRFARRLRSFSMTTRVMLTILRIGTVTNTTTSLGRQVSKARCNTRYQFVITYGTMSSFTTRLLNRRYNVVCRFLRNLKEDEGTRPVRRVLIMRRTANEYNGKRKMSPITPKISTLRGDTVPRADLMLLHRVQERVRRRLLFIRLRFRQIHSARLRRVQYDINTRNRVRRLEVIVNVSLMVGMSVVQINLIMFFSRQDRVHLVIAIHNPMESNSRTIVTTDNETNDHTTKAKIPANNREYHRTGGARSFGGVTPISLFFRGLSSSFRGEAFFC